MSAAQVGEEDEVRPAKPFVRWAGGKGRLVPELLKLAPKTFNTYREPFLGGGALFFALRPRYAVLSDANEELMHAYGIVQGRRVLLIEWLRLAARSHSKDSYYATRSLDPKTIDEVARAARMIYLNCTAFNGLYRVNKSGQFNVPWDPGRSGAVEENTIERASAALRGHRLLTQDFRRIEEQANKGDFIYFDPPYVPVTATANFTGYTTNGFTHKDQVDLRDLALCLKKRIGAYVLLSNSATPAVEALYGKDFELHPVSRSGRMNSKGDKRGAVKAYIIR